MITALMQKRKERTVAKLKDKIIVYEGVMDKGTGVDFKIQTLVRCKDCRYYQYDREFKSWECTHKKGLMECLPESFCSYAEENPQ